MSASGKGLSYFALAVSVLALLASLYVYAARPGRGADGGNRRTPPTRVSLSMVVATFSGQGVFAHRWYPTMLVVREGDTVDLAVANPDEFAHQLEVTGFDRKTKVLNRGETDRLTFVAEDVGVYAYRCALPYDPAKRHCTPDHDQMLGYLIVLAR